jgi:hypothetical protein
VLLVDVAHVHLTFVRIYFDPIELCRRPWRYALVPALTFAASVALYDLGAALFWRVLAYLAVFHFVRQQVGFLRLYHARMHTLAPWRRHLDVAAIYLATLHPLVWWHAHLPRHFEWFVAGDFATLPSRAASAMSAVTGTLWALTLGVCAFDTLRGWLRDRRGELGRDLLLASTALCWYLGIVVYDADYAFTVTNVFLHGVPYFVLVYMAGCARAEERTCDTLVARVFRAGPWVLVAIVWVTAFVEELLWDRGVWAERAWLFGVSDAELGAWHGWIVPLLSLPQATHYVLDGMIWRRDEAPELSRLGVRSASILCPERRTFQ